jgi:hypothetical protein
MKTYFVQSKGILLLISKFLIKLKFYYAYFDSAHREL